MSDALVTLQAPLSKRFSSKNLGEGSHVLLQGVFLAQGLNLSLLRWQAGSLPLHHQESHMWWVMLLIQYQVTC